MNEVNTLCHLESVKLFGRIAITVYKNNAAVLDLFNLITMIDLISLLDNLLCHFVV